MRNYEKVKSTLVELLKEEYLLREKSKNWYRLKEHQDEIYSYFKDKFGYELIVTGNMAKLQKYSVAGESVKGIGNFEKVEDYGILALCLDFLEDKYDGETILISELLEYIVSNYPVERDWRERGINLSLIRVLRYCEEKNLLKKLDGSETNFLSEVEDEILYENTGFSKYFMNTLPYNISELSSVEKLMEYNKKELSKEQVIRRTLLENFIVDSSFEHYPYLLEHRDTFALEFEHLLDMKLITFEEFSYLIKEEESSNISRSFPGRNNTEKLLIVFLNSIKQGEYTIKELLKIFKDFKLECNSLFTKGNLNKDDYDLLLEIIEYSQRLNILSVTGKKVRIGAFVKHFEIDLVKGDNNE